MQMKNLLDGTTLFKLTQQLLSKWYN